MTLDHRFVDGYQAATMARVFREYMEDPAAFDPPGAHHQPGSQRAALRHTDQRRGLGDRSDPTTVGA